VKSDDVRQLVIDARLLAQLINEKGPSAPRPSPRQLEILHHLVAGRSHRSTGEILGISQTTVDRHVANLYIKLHVSSRQQAIERARELGWLALECGGRDTAFRSADSTTTDSER
jgi:ATP/maltotriose-dependent transcriptional regulator MalT